MVRSNCICFAKGVSNGFFKIFNFVLIIFINCICVVALASVLMKTSGSTCHFVLMILFISG